MLNKYVCMHVKSLQWCLAVCDPRLLCPWDSLGKNTGVGCHFLLQGIFPIQGSNPGLPHCRRIFYQLSHKGSGGGEYKGNLCTFHLIFTVNLKLLLKIKSIFFKMSFPHSAVHGGCWQGFQLLGRQDKALLCALSLHRPRGPSGSRRAGV